MPAPEEEQRRLSPDAIVGRDLQSSFIAKLCLERDHQSRIKGFAAGSVSGVAKLVVGHPCDTLKVRMQCGEGMYKGLWDCFVKTVRLEGPTALYKGATPPLISWAISDAMLMGSLNSYRMYIAHWEANRKGTISRGRDSLSLTGHYLSGALAGLTICPVVTPFELLKAKLQMQTFGRTKLFTGPIDCAKQIIRAKGIFALWHGLTATLLFRVHIGQMFLSYELFMREFKKRNMKPGQASFLSGGLCSIVFWCFSFPPDVIKNRLMSDSFIQPRYTSYIDCLRQTWRDGGLKAFYRGFTPAILRAFPANASAIFAWETTMKLLQPL